LDFINWTGFVKQNKEFFVERYFCTLEGPGSLAAIDLPISSFQGRRRENESTYLSVVVADSDYYNQIVARQGGTLRVYMGYEVLGKFICGKSFFRQHWNISTIAGEEKSNQYSLSGTKHIPIHLKQLIWIKSVINESAMD